MESEAYRKDIQFFLQAIILNTLCENNVNKALLSFNFALMRIFLNLLLIKISHYICQI